jgi:MFS superfamily sulfate permease-like transporter
MPIRWKQNHKTLTALLIEAETIDGKPQERVLRALASIKNEDIYTYAGHINFWKDVSSVLEEFPDEIREQIVVDIAQKIAQIPDWVIQKMEELLEEHRQQGEVILAAMNEERKRHEARIAELTRQRRQEINHLEERQRALMAELGLVRPKILK